MAVVVCKGSVMNTNETLSRNTGIVIVSGLPRSGTSMMMRMLGAGGLAVMTDNLRQPDEDNPLGYYEYEAVKRIGEDFSWLAAEGKALKVVSMILYRLPADRHYKIIFMDRDIDEVLASQRKMLERRGNAQNQEEDRNIKRIFLNHLASIINWLSAQKNIGLLCVSYNETLRAPQITAAAVNRFLGGGLDEVSMAATVSAGLYRNRKPGENQVH